MQRRKPVLARWLNNGRVVAVVTKGLVGARDHFGIRVYLAGWTDHPHDSPEPAECYRIEHRCRTKLRIGYSVCKRGHRWCWSGEDVVRSIARRAESMAAWSS